MISISFRLFNLDCAWRSYDVDWPKEATLQVLQFLTGTTTTHLQEPNLRSSLSLFNLPSPASPIRPHWVWGSRNQLKSSAKIERTLGHCRDQPELPRSSATLRATAEDCIVIAGITHSPNLQEAKATANLATHASRLVCWSSVYYPRPANFLHFNTNLPLLL